MASNRLAEAYRQSQYKQQEIARRWRMWQKIKSPGRNFGSRDASVGRILPQKHNEANNDEADFYKTVCSSYTIFNDE